MLLLKSAELFYLSDAHLKLSFHFVPFVVVVVVVVVAYLHLFSDA